MPKFVVINNPQRFINGCIYRQRYFWITPLGLPQKRSYIAYSSRNLRVHCKAKIVMPTGQHHQDCLIFRYYAGNACRGVYRSYYFRWTANKMDDILYLGASECESIWLKFWLRPTEIPLAASGEYYGAWRIANIQIQVKATEAYGFKSYRKKDPDLR